MPPKKAKTTETDAPADPKPAAKKKPKADHAGRPVAYPQLEARVYAVGTEHGPLTRDVMRAIVGHEEETEEKPFGDDYLYRLPCSGKKVRWTNNDHNRQLYESWAATIAQDVLNRRFAPKGPNGETAIVGRTGVVVSAQHRFAALDFACDRWASDAEGKHWRKLWPEQPYLETFMALGVDESDETIATIDNTRPRNFADVLFSDPAVFGKKLNPAARKAMGRIADYGVRFLWHRVGADLDAFSPRRTPSESMDFLRRHGRLKEMVKHVHSENADNRLTNLLSGGTLTGLAYLMAASATDPAKYQAHAEPSERQLDLSRWERAEEFVTVLASGPEGDLGAVHGAIGALANEATLAKATPAERVVVLTKAWLLFAAGEKVTEAAVMPEYAGEGDDRTLTNVPTVGGIDRGEPREEAEPEETPETAEAVADEKAKVDDEHLKAKRVNKKQESLLKDLATHREEHPGKTLVFKAPKGPYRFFAEDAVLAAPVLHAALLKVHGTEIDCVDVEEVNYDAAVRKLARAGHAMVLLTEGDDGFVTSEEVKPKPVVPGGGK